MPASANITISDGQTTPVAHTFAPAKTSADYSLHEDRISGLYIGYNKLTMSLTRPNAKSRNIKLMVKVETPKLETLGTSASGFTPPPTVAYRPVCEVVFTFPERCALQDRKDLQAFVKNMFSNAFLTSAVENFELPY